MIKAMAYFAASLVGPFVATILLGVAGHYAGYQIDIAGNYRWFSGFSAGLFSYWMWVSA